LQEYANVFDGIKPWDGEVPSGFFVDFLGTLTDARFRVVFGVDPASVGGTYAQTRLPIIEDGEGWFEAANWILAARTARDRYVMVTLGACYGAQAVGSCRALKLLNPMPYKLVAIEPEPENYEWVRRHMMDNDIDPDNQWLIKSAVSARNDPVLFPIGSPGSGAQNCVSTNEDRSRQIYADEIISTGRSAEVVRSLMTRNSTGIIKNLVPGSDFPAEIQMVSAVTLQDILGPFNIVDYLESDIQQSEILVFPPFMNLVKRKVRRVHIGTHGKEVHNILLQLFERDGWDIVFNFEPNSSFSTPMGNFSTNDGVLTVVNPDL
jgi:FkbM family methyltransferase